MQITIKEIQKILRERIDSAGGLRKAAIELDVSAPYLSDVMLGRRAPGPKIVKPLGYKRIRRTKVWFEEAS